MPRTRHLLWSICLLALALRVLYILDVSDQPLFAHLVVDQLSYDEWAVEIAAGAWIGDDVFYQDPFYPYFLAVIYSIFGRSLGLVYLIQSALSAFSCLLVFGIGRRAFGDERVGLLAALFWALYEVDFFYQAQILKTGPGTCLGMLALWLLLVARDRSTPWVCAAAGVAAGLLPLYRGPFLVVVPLLISALAWDWWKRSGRAALVPTLSVSLGALLVLFAVAVRNYAVSGELILTTAQAGQNFYYGHNDLANGRAVQLPFVRPHPRFERADFHAEAERRTGRAMTAPEVSRFWLGESVGWALENPGRAIAVTWLKLRILLYRVEAPDNLNFDFFRTHLSTVLKLPLPAFWLAGPLGVAGLVLALARRRAGMLALYVLPYAATMLMTFVLSRYRMAIVPVLLVYAAYALLSLWEAVRSRNRSALLWLLVPLVLCAAVAYPRWTQSKFDVAWARMGSAWLAAEEPAEAAEAYRKALEVNPRLLHACIGLGQAQEKGGRDGEALQTYVMCARTHPESARPHVALAVLHLRNGDDERGIAEFRRALEIEPGNPQAREGLRRLGYGAL